MCQVEPCLGSADPMGNEASRRTLPHLNNGQSTTVQLSQWPREREANLPKCRRDSAVRPPSLLHIPTGCPPETYRRPTGDPPDAYRTPWLALRYHFLRRANLTRAAAGGCPFLGRG